MARFGRSFPDRQRQVGRPPWFGVTTAVSVTATVGAFAISGALSHTVQNGVTTSGTVAAVTIDGNNHNVYGGGTVTAAQSSLTVTGLDVTVASIQSFTVDQSTLAVDGVAGTVVYGARLVADAPSLVATGFDATVRDAGRLFVGRGAFAVAGFNAVVQSTVSVSPTPTTLTIGSNVAVVNVGRQVNVIAGELAVETAAVSLVNGVEINVGAASLSFTAATAVVKTGEPIVAGLGSITFQGNPFTRAGQELVYASSSALVVVGLPVSLDAPPMLPVESWRNPRRPAFTGPLAPVGEVFDSLEKYLRRPVMPNGFVLGDTSTGTPNAVTWLDVSSFSPTALVDTVPPEALTGVAVTGYAKALLVRWDETSDDSVTQYEVQVGTDAAFRTIVASRTSGGNNCLVSGLSYDTPYFVRVRALDVSNNVGPWSLTATGECDRLKGYEDLVAGSVTADALAANSVTAGKLDAVQLGVGKYIRSTVYNAGKTGWSIDASGSAEFNNVTVRGTLATTNLATGNQLTVFGTIQSNTFQSGKSGWQINGDGTAQFNNVVVRADLDTSSIRSGGVLTVYGRMQAPGGSTWFIDGSGNAEFNSLKVRITGPSTVGTAGTTGAASVSSPGATTPTPTTSGNGWSIKDDGSAFFANVTVKGDVIGSRILGGQITGGQVIVAKTGDLKSEDYVHEDGSGKGKGWIVKGDGSAEFNNVFVRNTIFASGEIRSDVKITAPIIAGGQISGAKISGQEIIGGTIKGSTITGATISTADSGPRIALEDDDVDTLRFYTGNGYEFGSINAESNRLTIVSPNESGVSSYVRLYGSADDPEAEANSYIMLGAGNTVVEGELNVVGSVYSDENVQGVNVYADVFSGPDNTGAWLRIGDYGQNILRFQWDGQNLNAYIDNVGPFQLT